MGSHRGRVGVPPVVVTLCLLLVLTLGPVPQLEVLRASPSFGSARRAWAEWHPHSLLLVPTSRGSPLPLSPPTPFNPLLGAHPALIDVVLTGSCVYVIRTIRAGGIALDSVVAPWTGSCLHPASLSGSWTTIHTSEPERGATPAWSRCHTSRCRLSSPGMAPSGGCAQ